MARATETPVTQRQIHRWVKGLSMQERGMVMLRILMKTDPKRAEAIVEEALSPASRRRAAIPESLALAAALPRELLHQMSRRMPAKKMLRVLSVRTPQQED